MEPLLEEGEGLLEGHDECGLAPGRGHLEAQGPRVLQHADAAEPGLGLVQQVAGGLRGQHRDAGLGGGQLAEQLAVEPRDVVQVAAPQRLLGPELRVRVERLGVDQPPVHALVFNRDRVLPQVLVPGLEHAAGVVALLRGRPPLVPGLDQLLQQVLVPVLDPE